MTSVTFENNSNVTTVDNSAFSGCTSLQTINFGISPTLQTIGNSAFSGCTQLSQISIPSSVTSIDSSAFANCTSLTSIALPNNLTTIGSYAFSGCSNLSSIIIPSSVTRIGSGAFENCTSLPNVNLPNSITTIESSTFSGCSSLSGIRIPSSVTRIDYGAFRNCSGLTSISISNNITTVGVNAFYGCSNLSIYITGRTSVPSGWNYDWNPSDRPIYFNGIPHTHYDDGLEMTGNHYHGLKKVHHYEFRIYCTKCKFTFETYYDTQSCSGPPCVTPYSLPPFSELYHSDDHSHFNDLPDVFKSSTFIYIVPENEYQERMFLR